MHVFARPHRSTHAQAGHRRHRRSPLWILTVLLAAPATKAQSVQQAVAFIDSTYSYTPDLVDLIRSDAELASTGGAVKLDFDPLCSCQDPTAVKSKRVSVKKTSPSSATAQVRLLYADGTGRSLSLDLQWLSDGWRIRDVHASTIPSLRRFLQRPAETSNSAPRSSSSTLRP
jgi:hypothetical protein